MSRVTGMGWGAIVFSVVLSITGLSGIVMSFIVSPWSWWERGIVLAASVWALFNAVDAWRSR